MQYCNFFFSLNAHPTEWHCCLPYKNCSQWAREKYFFFKFALISCVLRNAVSYLKLCRPADFSRTNTAYLLLKHTRQIKIKLLD